MSSSHTVIQGECLSSIARRYGFASHAVLWDHPGNAGLKKLRMNPNVLFPGDSVFIPSRVLKAEAAETDVSHRFVLETEKLVLRLVLEDRYAKPLAQARCELQVDGRTVPLTADGDGRIETKIDPLATLASLTVHPKSPAVAFTVPIDISHLDPVDETSGLRERLNNLGYCAGPVPAGTEEDSAAVFQSAIEEFQCEHGLVVDGKAGPATKAKLKQVHGC